MTNGVDFDLAVERMFELLVRGDRDGTRAFGAELIRGGMTPRELLANVFWPVHEKLDQFFRNDQVTDLSYRLATRLLRQFAAQVGGALERPTTRTRSIFMTCGPCETEELGAQIAADLLESDGFRVTLAGGGIPLDELLSHAHALRPDVLCMFCSAPTDLPTVRQAIDHIRGRDALPDTQIVVGGGVFNRASGLAEEIGADLWADDPIELALVLSEEPERRMSQDQRTVGKQRKAA